MNIDDSSQIRQCTSCQMCGAVCPVGAITITKNKFGFYRPIVNTDKCIDCGLCVKTCYKFDGNIQSTKSLDGKKLFSAWAKDKDIVASTTSGGIADILVKRLISQGYKCIGIEYDSSSNRAISKIASTLEDTDSFKGSKYIQAYTVNSFKELVRNHKNEKFAVFGLPCHIYALDKYLRTTRTRHQHLLIDLYCHGCPSLNLWDKYVDKILKEKDCSKVVSVNFRSKVRGWGNFYVVVVVVEGVNGRRTYTSPRINDPFYTMFFSNMVLNDSCSDCQLRSTLEYTDIRLGDYWGNKFLNNHTGVSGVTICSENGMNLFKKATNDIEYNEQLFESFLPFQSYEKQYDVNFSTRNELLLKLSEDNIDLKDIIRLYNKSLSYKKRFLSDCKNVVMLFPNNIISSVKSLAYKLKYK